MTTEAITPLRHLELLNSHRFYYVEHSILFFALWRIMLSMCSGGTLLKKYTRRATNQLSAR